MRKILLTLTLVLMLALLPCWALAENTDGHGDLLIQSEGVAAYVDGNGHLLIPGNASPVNKHVADKVIDVNPYRVVFMGTPDGTDAPDLVSIDFTTWQEQVIAENVYAAIGTQSELLYYTLISDRTQLYQVNFDLDRVVPFFTFSEPIESLYDMQDGLVVSFVEDAGSMIWSDVTGAFEPYGEALPVKSVRGDGYQAYIADGSALYVKREGSTAADYVDQNVFDFAIMNDVVYYIANTGSAVRIKRYDPNTLEQRVILTPEERLTDQIAASQTGLYVLGTDDTVFRISHRTATLMNADRILVLDTAQSSRRAHLPS